MSAPTVSFYLSLDEGKEMQQTPIEVATGFLDPPA